MKWDNCFVFFFLFLLIQFSFSNFFQPKSKNFLKVFFWGFRSFFVFLVLLWGLDFDSFAVALSLISLKCFDELVHISQRARADSESVDMMIRQQNSWIRHNNPVSQAKPIECQTLLLANGSDFVQLQRILLQCRTNDLQTFQMRFFKAIQLTCNLKKWKLTVSTRKNQTSLQVSA